jgi:opacity protein-like surface antigen
VTNKLPAKIDFFTTAFRRLSLLWLSTALLAVTGTAASQSIDERVIRQLGGSTRFCSAPIQTVDDVRAMAVTYREDLETVLSMAGLSSITNEFLENMARDDIGELSVPPGQRLEWMALRRPDGPDLIRNARWEGDEPFDAFVVIVVSGITQYEFLIPKACGNLALLRTVSAPVLFVPPDEPTEDDEPAEPVADEDPTPAPRQAEPEPDRATDWYVAGDVGYVGISDGDYDFIGAAVIPHEAEFDGGLGYFVQVGRRFDNLRVEVELGRRSNDADRFGSFIDVVAARGSLDANSLMLNGVYDFRIGERLRPYLGAGIGGARIKADAVRKAVNDPDRTGALLGSDNRFAWQALAGVSWQLAERWALTLNYRYFDAGDARIEYGVGCEADGANCIFRDQLDQEYNPHTVSAGVRYDF